MDLLHPNGPLTVRTAYRFKDCIVPAVVGPRHQAGAADQPGAHVAHHVAIQVWHHHHIKLLRVGHQLIKASTWVRQKYGSCFP